MATTRQKQRPQPGERVAYVCTDKDCNPRQRAFDDPGWKCPVHGKSKRQGNARYFGTKTLGGL